MNKTETPIPISWWDLIRVLITLAALALVVGSFFFTAPCWNELGIGWLGKENFTKISQSLIITPLILNYCTIAASTIAATAVVKRGFGNLKKPEEKGLIRWLVICLPGCLGVGFIIGFVFGILKDFVFTLTFGLMTGLFVGLGVGLINGLAGEFKKESKTEPAPQPTTQPTP